MLIGSTVKLKATFKDFDGVVADPTNVVIRFYDSKKIKTGEDIPAIKTGTGEYEYDYEVKQDNKAFYEFSGILDGLPVATRKPIIKKWTD